MSHTSAVFNHSCLKIPVNPENKLPAPIYEQKLINQLKNQSLKENILEDSCNKLEKMKNSKALQNSKYKAFIDFYDSIPDYSDVNHLSTKEFYRKLEALKAKQKCYYEYLDIEYKLDNRVESSPDDYKEEIKGKRKTSALKQNTKNEIKSSTAFRDTPDTEDSLSSCKEIVVAPPSRRSVRIESPKSDSFNIESPRFHSLQEKSKKRNISSADSKFSESSKFIHSFTDSLGDEDKDFCDDILKNNELDEDIKDCGTRSLPNSPTRKKNTSLWNDCGITIPKPFKMTVRLVYLYLFTF